MKGQAKLSGLKANRPWHSGEFVSIHVCSFFDFLIKMMVLFQAGTSLGAYNPPLKRLSNPCVLFFQVSGKNDGTFSGSDFTWCL